MKCEKKLFYKDALIFDNLKENIKKIRLNNGKNSIIVSLKNWTNFGLWSAKNADFICIEPWMGLADFENSSQILEKKSGILKLKSGETFTQNYSIKISLNE